MTPHRITPLPPARRSAKRKLGWKICLLAIVAAAFASATPAVRADTMSYSIDVSSSLALTESPTNPSVQLQVSDQSALVDRVADNNPVVELTNTSTTADISSVQLTLNDPESVIEAVKVLSSDGTATGAFANNVYGGPATSLDIALATPLAPGQSILWEMELAPVNGYGSAGWTPGYQNILFPGSNPVPGTNASFDVTYTDPTTGTPTSSSYVLPDLSSFDPAVTVQPTTVCSSTGTATGLFTLSVPSTTPTPTPEPGTIVLMGIGLVPLAVRVWRKRRQPAGVVADAIA
jgi:hypothetical protein